MTNPSGHRDLGKQIGGDDTDKGGRACQLALGFDDVGSPAQKIDRQAGPDAPREVWERARSRQLLAEIFRKFPDQNRDHVACGIDLGDQRRYLRLQLR